MRFTYLFGRQSENERKRDLPSNGLLPNWLQKSQEPGTPPGSPHEWQGAQALGPSVTTFQRHISRALSGSRAAETRMGALKWGAGVVSSGRTTLRPNADPKTSLKKCFQPVKYHTGFSSKATTYKGKKILRGSAQLHLANGNTGSDLKGKREETAEPGRPVTWPRRIPPAEGETTGQHGEVLATQDRRGSMM